MNDSLKRRGLLLCIVGPAGSGKTSLSARLCACIQKDLKVSVSVTTRKAREGELEGESYFFVSETRFDQLIEQREFVEWEQVHGFRYGTLKRTLNEAVESGQDLLLRIDIRGAISLKRLFPRDTVIVFLVPPRFAELKTRLQNRSPVANEELSRRLETASKELNLLVSELNSGLIDYVLVNDKFDASINALIAVVTAERMRAERISIEDVRNLSIEAGQ